MTSDGFNNSIVGGIGALIRSYIRSPNYQPGVSGWSINKDGSAEFNNVLVRGLLQAASISSSSIGNSTLTNDTIYDTSIVIDNTGGTILVYALSGQTVQTITTTGAGVFAVPAGVTKIKVECWAGGGGSMGKNSATVGGGGGGGGEYACEPNYAVTPLANINYNVGTGGGGGINGLNPGGLGIQTFFDGTFSSAGVNANGGVGSGIGSTGHGTGGSGSTNTIHFNGGNGGQAGTGGGGGGGGSSGGTGAVGGNGANASGATGGAGGTVSGGGTGGAGGNSGVLGNVGVVPGGGGGGAGASGSPRAGSNGAAGQLRLTYAGTRQLIASIAGVAGIDQYGFSYPAGVRSNIVLADNLAGGYFEEVIPSAQSIPHSAIVTLTGFTSSKLLSDSGSAFNLSTGTWTCPEDGIYTITANIHYSAWVAGSRSDLSTRLGGSIELEQDSTSTSGSITTTGTLFIAAGTTCIFDVIQETGAAQTIQTSTSIISFLRQA